MAKAKFDIKTEASRPIYAGVGVTDLAVELVRDYVADVQKRFVDVQARVSDFDFQPKALRDQAITVVNARVTDNVVSVTETYSDLAKRGETLVERIRRQQSTQAAVSSAKTTSAKAKTTRTQATKATKTTAKATKSTAKKTAKKASTTAKRTSTAPRSSAKATTTAAKKTASNAAAAATDAAVKVGD